MIERLQERAASVNKHDVAAKAVEDGGELHRNVSTADYEHALG